MTKHRTLLQEMTDPDFEKFMGKLVPANVKRASLPSSEKIRKDIRMLDPKNNISVHSFFGSAEEKALNDIGIFFYEKPDYWSDLEHSYPGERYKPITMAQVEKAEKRIGIPFKVYTQDEVFLPVNTKSKRSYDDSKDGFFPGSRAKKQAEKVYIVHMRDGSKYLVDGTQASTYIRMWARIKE